MVKVQKHLIDHLKIDQLLSVAGGSMGGMQALEWIAAYPDKAEERHGHCLCDEAFPPADCLQ